MFFNDVGHYGLSICGRDVMSIFPSTRTCPELYPETSLFVESHLPSNVVSSNMSVTTECWCPMSIVLSVLDSHWDSIRRCFDDVVIYFFNSGGGLRSHDKILCSDWSPPLLVEELACRHVGLEKILFKNAALYVKSCVETFFSVKVMGKYVIQTWVSYDKRGI